MLLAKSLPEPTNLGYTLYLDNLFTNIPLATALGELGIGVMGTTRATASGFPKELAQLKQIKKPLEWGYLETAITNGAQCFLWQDNNCVLGITTAYNLRDTVIRPRKRPSATSTNAAITRPIFGDSPVKDLPIPMAIDAYNHHMGGVDIANQYREAFTTLRTHNNRYWKPLFYSLLDIALVNSCLLSKASKGLERGASRDCRDHRKFQEALVEALLAYSDTPSQEHQGVVRPKRAYCAYCRANLSNWHPKNRQHRRFGVEISGNSRGRLQGSRVNWGCDQCDVPLCKTGDCWRLGHIV